MTSVAPRLAATHVRLAYDARVIVDDLSVVIPDGRITAVVGANACGKSTLLRALARLLKPQAGSVVLDGQEIHTIKTKEVARRLGVLPQSPIAPAGITVADLIARGRSPHQRLLQQWSTADERAVVEAMEATRTLEIADRAVDELSGGQRQRVWIALALAQQTPLLLLDEPTTFLDIAHQVEVLELVADLNLRRRTTVVMVLHDLNQACRYAHHVVAMKQGRIVADGDPTAVVTTDLVHEVFGLECVVIADPVSGTPLVVPAARRGIHLDERHDVSDIAAAVSHTRGPTQGLEVPANPERAPRRGPRESTLTHEAKHQTNDPDPVRSRDHARRLRR